jgi:repressor LexA
MNPLTDTQEEVYEFIKEFLVNSHSTPTYMEISDHFGWASGNSSYGHVKALCKKGYLEKHGDNSGKYLLALHDVKLIKRRSL